MKGNTFTLELNEDWFKQYDIINIENNTAEVINIEPTGNGFLYKCQILGDPYRKWYKLFWQWLTLGLYQAPYEYEIKLLN